MKTVVRTVPLALLVASIGAAAYPVPRPNLIPGGLKGFSKADTSFMPVPVCPPDDPDGCQVDHGPPTDPTKPGKPK